MGSILSNLLKLIPTILKWVIQLLPLLYEGVKWVIRIIREVKKKPPGETGGANPEGKQPMDPG